MNEEDFILDVKKLGISSNEEQLKEFIINIWRSKAEYKVLMNRLFNLNYILTKENNVQDNDKYSTDNIISDTALLLCAEEIAQYYNNFKRFPRILIADDLLNHGREIIRLLDNFETLIVEFLSNKNIKIDKKEVHENLFSAVNIYVFAQNKEGILIDRRYAFKAEYYLPLNEFKGFSQQISNALQTCKIANTNYSLSIDLPLYFSKKLHSDNSLEDESYTFQYRGFSNYYYYKYYKNLLKLIHISEPINNTVTERKLTSLVLFDKIQSPDFDWLCNLFAITLSTIIPNSRIIEILNYNNEKLAVPKAQLLAFLLSIECTVDFLKERFSVDNETLYFLFLKSDYLKISANFGKSSTIKYEIIKLFKSICFNNSFKNNLSDIVSEYTQTMNGFEKDDLSSLYFKKGSFPYTQENNKPYEVVEDIFYEIGINSECAATNFINENKRFDPIAPRNNSIRLNQYLSIMNNRNIDSLTSIEYISGMMDSGLLSIDFEMDKENVHCILKSGELATYVLPRRFSTFIPALAIIEKYFINERKDPRFAIIYFLDYIEDYYYKQDNYIQSKDENQLEKLKKSKGSFMYMYFAGQFFQDWNTELLTTGDIISHIKEQYQTYNIARYHDEKRNEDLRKKQYVKCADQLVKKIGSKK